MLMRCSHRPLCVSWRCKLLHWRAQAQQIHMPELCCTSTKKPRREPGRFRIVERQMSNNCSPPRLRGIRPDARNQRPTEFRSAFVAPMMPECIRNWPIVRERPLRHSSDCVNQSGGASGSPRAAWRGRPTRRLPKMIAVKIASVETVIFGNAAFNRSARCAASRI